MSKLYIVNQRMLRWMDYAIQNEICFNQKDWCEKIGFHAPNISQINTGKQSFTLLQIEKAAKLINGNTNWLFDLEKNMLRVNGKTTPLQLLKQATIAIEEDFKKKK